MTSVPSDETGLCWWTEPGHEPVFLLVENGRVVGCTKYAEKWALGKTSGPLLDRGERFDVKVEWTPLNSVPTLRPAHLVPHARLRRWSRTGDRGIVTSLEFGRATDGRFMIHDTREPDAWFFGDRDGCLRELRRRLAADTWRRVAANYDASGPLPDPELPDGWGGVPD